MPLMCHRPVSVDINGNSMQERKSLGINALHDLQLGASLHGHQEAHDDSPSPYPHQCALAPAVLGLHARNIRVAGA